MADRPTACDDWQPDLAAWLTLDIAPDREQALLEHLAGCETCRAEADSLQAVAASLLAAPAQGQAVSGTAAPTPPADLEGRILRRIAAERGRRRRVRIAALVAAATVAGLVLAATLVGSDSGLPDGTEVAFRQVPRGVTVEAVMVDDDGGTIVRLQADGLDPDVTYALWMSPPDDGDRIPAGTFRPDADGTVDAELRCAYPASRYARVWATAEGEVVLDTA